MTPGDATPAEIHEAIGNLWARLITATDRRERERLADYIDDLLDHLGALTP